MPITGNINWKFLFALCFSFLRFFSETLSTLLKNVFFLYIVDENENIFVGFFFTKLYLAGVLSSILAWVALTVKKLQRRVSCRRPFNELKNFSLRKNEKILHENRMLSENGKIISMMDISVSYPKGYFMLWRFT